MFTKLIAGSLLSMGLLFAGLSLGHPSTTDCCAKKMACCTEGAVCCRQDKPACCAEGAACCQANAECCNKAQ